MAFEATMRHGDPLMIDYTPSSGDVAAGQVVSLGNLAGLTCGIAHRDIANNTLGALAAGGGVYAVKNVANLANYAKAWWDDTNNGLTGTSTNNSQFGYVVGNGGGGANSVCFALHFPRA